MGGNLQHASLFVGRQPIIDNADTLVAYEVLLRTTNTLAAAGMHALPPCEQAALRAAAIKYAFDELGVEAALGGKTGHISVSTAFLLSEVVEMLPPERIVLQLQAAEPVTAAVIARCRALAARGYRLALGEVTRPGDLDPGLLPLVAIVKIDVAAVPPDELPALAALAGREGAALLATNIATAAQNRLCQCLGFSLYQGYFFARPVIVPGAAVHSSSLVLMKLATLINQDAEIEALEDVLKHAPDLTLRLLRMVNSAALARRRRIESVRNAILVLGREQLGRLVQIMMFRHQNRVNTGADPVTELAVIRGRLMETVAQALGKAELSAIAFMTGMLSLVDTLFGQELADIVEQLGLDEAVGAALLRHEGELGMLLELAQASELQHSGHAQALLTQLGMTDFDQFNRLQLDALRWAGTV